MKRAMAWSDEDDDSSSDERSSSNSDPEADNVSGKTTKPTISSKPHKSSNQKTREVNYGKKKSGAIDFEALRQHGYKGGLSVLNVPPPKEEEKQDWSWSTGTESHETKETVESYTERQKTRAALMDGEQLTHVQTRKEKNLSFSQKEKRKRDLGQASRGKNYVEEEKRMLRESGVYSGFDT